MTFMLIRLGMERGYNALIDVQARAWKQEGKLCRSVR
jgi:hypothetical protein